MQLPIPNSKPVQMGLCVGLVVLIALVVFFGPVGQKLGAFLPSEPKTAPALPQVRNPATPSRPPERPSGNKPSSGQSAQAQTTGLALPQLPVAGNLEELTRLQAEIEEGLLRKKLAELPGKDALPPMEAGTAVHDAKQEQSKAQAPVIPVFEPLPTVVSVQGVDGRLTATLRDRGALATFRAGESCSAGKITRITRDVVVLQGRNGTERLFFE